MTTPELDPVEKARAAFEAMTKAMLDAGRQYEERMNEATTAALSALLAEVERLREERDEFERRYSTVLRNLNVAQPERDRLRAGIEALAGDPTAQDETGTWIDRKRVADLLAGSGEQPGCPCYDTGGNYGVCDEHDEDAAPVVPDHEINALCLVDGCEVHGTQPMASRSAPAVPDSPDVRERARGVLTAAPLPRRPDGEGRTVSPTWRRRLCVYLLGHKPHDGRCTRCGTRDPGALGTTQPHDGAREVLG